MFGIGCVKEVIKSLNKATVRTKGQFVGLVVGGLRDQIVNKLRGE